MSAPLTGDQVNTLADMLTYCRPHGTPGDELFRDHFLRTLPEICEDAHGNLHLVIGDSPILWSSHTDTVHTFSGFQSVHVNRDRGTIALSRKELKRAKRRSRYSSDCLGADDTAGVFLMREMILRGVPGHYVFHYGEERGCIGSSSLADLDPQLLDGARFAIALDRAGTADVVTHQLGTRCASDRFAHSLAAQLLDVDPRMAPARGVFTDTAEYMHLIPECTNISVGYYHQHSPDEYQDYVHLGRLLAALCTLDANALVCNRTPARRETKIWTFLAPSAPAPAAPGPTNTRLSLLSPLDDPDEDGDEVITDTDDLDWCDVCRAYAYEDDDPRWYTARLHCECTPDDRKMWKYLNGR